jgi:hypothetical protein
VTRAALLLPLKSEESGRPRRRDARFIRWWTGDGLPDAVNTQQPSQSTICAFVLSFPNPNFKYVYMELLCIYPKVLSASVCATVVARDNWTAHGLFRRDSPVYCSDFKF